MTVTVTVTVTVTQVAQQLGVFEKHGHLFGPGTREFAKLLANSNDVYIKNLCQVLSSAEQVREVCVFVRLSICM